MNNEPVPRDTLTPAFSNFWTGQNPDASFIFDEGQWATFAFLFLSNSISSSLSWVIWTATRLGETRPRRSKLARGRHFSADLCFVIDSFPISESWTSSKDSCKCTWNGTWKVFWIKNIKKEKEKKKKEKEKMEEILEILEQLYML